MPSAKADGITIYLSRRAARRLRMLLHKHGLERHFGPVKSDNPIASEGRAGFGAIAICSRKNQFPRFRLRSSFLV